MIGQRLFYQGGSACFGDIKENTPLGAYRRTVTITLSGQGA